MRKPLKWVVQVDDRPHPIGAGPVLHVDTLHGNPHEVAVWTLEDLDNGPMSRQAQIFGTGMNVPEDSEWIGTCVHGEGAEKGVLVWHVFAW